MKLTKVGYSRFKLNESGQSHFKKIGKWEWWYRGLKEFLQATKELIIN